MDSPAITISCPECGTSFDFEPPAALLQNPGSIMNFRCSNCEHRFDHALGVEEAEALESINSVLQEEMPSQPSRSETEVRSEPASPAASVSDKTAKRKRRRSKETSSPDDQNETEGQILVRNRNRQRFLALSWEEVGQLIESGLLGPKGKVAVHGGRWKRAETLPELQSYFNPDGPSPKPEPIKEVTVEESVVQPSFESEPQTLETSPHFASEQDPQSKSDDVEVTPSENWREETLVPQNFQDLSSNISELDAITQESPQVAYDEIDTPQGSDAIEDSPSQDTQTGFDFNAENLDGDGDIGSEPMSDFQTEESFVEPVQSEVEPIADGAIENDLALTSNLDENFTAPIGESDMDTPVFVNSYEQNADAIEPDYGDSFGEKSETDELLDSIGSFDGTLGDLEFESDIETSSKATSSQSRDSTVASFQPKASSSYSSASSASPYESSSSSARNQSPSYPSAILPVDDDSESHNVTTYAKSSNKSEDEPLDSGPDYPIDGPDYSVDGPDYPVDGPDYPDDDDGFEDFESYQQTMNRRVRLIIGAVLVIVTPLVYFLYPTVSKSPTLLDIQQTDKDTESIDPQDEDPLLTPSKSEETVAEPAADQEGEIEGGKEAPQNIEESASGKDAIEGDAVTGLSDTNGESSKTPGEGIEKIDSETQTVDIQDLATVAETASTQGSEGSTQEMDNVNGSEGSATALGEGGRSSAKVNEAYEENTTFDPTKVDSLRLKREGWLRVQQRRYDEAEQIFAYAIEQDPEDVHSLHGLGWAYQEQGKVEKAKAQYCRLVSIENAPLDLKRECSARVKALDMNCEE